MGEQKRLFDKNCIPDLRLVIRLNRSANLLNRKAGAIFRAHGLTTMQFAVLEALYHKGDMQIGQIIGSVLATSGNMTVVINNLEKEGLVKKHCNPKDNRAFIVSLTDAGRRRIEAVFPKYLNDMRATMSVLTKEEKEAVAKALKKLYS